MEWRPFAAVFVPNTLKEFIARHDFNAENKVNRSSSPIRYRPTDQEVQVQHVRFQELRKKVAVQRKEIKLRDEVLIQNRRRRLEQDLSKALLARQMRQNYSEEVRVLARSRACQSFRHGRPERTPGVASEDSLIFALTGQGAESGAQSSRLRNYSSREAIQCQRFTPQPEKDMQVNTSLPLISLHDSREPSALQSHRPRAPRLG